MPTTLEKRKNVILFTWDSSVALRKNLSAWTDSFVEKYGDTNVAKVRIGETDPSMVASELLSMPFFAEKRLVVFEGIPKTKWGSAGASSDEDAATETPNDPTSAIEASVLSVFDSIPDSTVAIFVSETPNKTSALYKKLLAGGDVKNFAWLSLSDAEDFISDRLPGITQRAVRTLLERTAKNPERRKNEDIEVDDRRLRWAVEKLSLGFGNSRIDEKEIDEAEPQTSNQKAYLLGEYVLSGDIRTAVTALRSILEKDSPYAVFPSIVSTVRRNLHVELLRRNGKTDAEICELTGYSAYPVKIAKRMSDSEFLSAKSVYSALVKFETDWRTWNAPGEDENAQLETWIVSATLSGKKRR